MSNPPSLIEFVEQHPTEEDCWQFLRQARWGEQGFTCPACGEDEHWGRIRTRDLFECYECHKQTSVTAGTILQDTKLDLKTWFLAIYHVVVTKKGISEPELARKLGVHAETAHNLRQKVYRILRYVEQRPLQGIVEADETYVGGKRPDDPSGRGTSKAPVVALVESKGTHAGDLHLRHVPDAGAETLGAVVRDRVETGAVVWTDGWHGYRGLDAYTREVRQPDRDEGEEMHDVLPWSHTVFGNLKRVLYGVHSYVEDWNVQPYLDAFTFRFNHRPFLGRALEKALSGVVETPPRPNDRLKRSGQLGVAG